MSVALAFDIYGTLIDPHGVVGELQKHVGEQAPEFSRTWREKQLEYTWRRGLMGRYADFGVCTAQALDYADTLLATGLADDVKASLLQAYRVLPAFDDVAASMQALRATGCKLYPFSNGTEDMVDAVLSHAGIAEYFEPVISVDTLRTFKPDPRVYRYVVDVTGVEPDNCWLVSSNPFDVIGAVSAGINAAWLQRSAAAVFDPWEIRPTAVIGGLAELPALLNQTS
ncbi:MAG: haloacid dehalogenase type II [Gammaproteobacteria bacterium]|nr:haloacid dehalogenase type II [Gammaproteobacteria bacterium]